MFTPFGDLQHQEYDPLTKVVTYQKLTTLYKNPLSHTQLQISVGYRYNETFPSAIENQLLRSSEYEEWEQKKKALVPLFTRVLESSCHKIWLTVTGLEFRTVADDGELAWKTFEDKEEILARIPASDIPPHVTMIDISELTDVSDLSGSVYTAEYQDKTHAVKIHEESYQNTDFRAEVEARIRMGKLPHVVGMIGLVINNFRVPDRSYVQGILIEYCPKGTLKSLLRASDPPVEPSIKKRWAAQIAHGISAIHGAGLIHGDLRCENVVVDENEDARIIDISNGSAFMMGWHPVLDRVDDPRRDVYGLFGK
jgi:serine/threonine protein kinase